LEHNEPSFVFVPYCTAFIRGGQAEAGADPGRNLKDIFDIYDCEQLKDLYMKALEIREKVLSPENFEFIKNLDFDIMIKEQLIKLYGKYNPFE
jgi:hypothetical protein